MQSPVLVCPFITSPGSRDFPFSAFRASSPTGTLLPPPLRDDDNNGCLPLAARYTCSSSTLCIIVNMTIQREDYCADHTNNCCTLYQNHRYTSRPTDWWRRSARLFARLEGEGADAASSRSRPGHRGQFKERVPRLLRVYWHLSQCPTSQGCPGGCEPEQEAQAICKPQPLHLVFTF